MARHDIQCDTCQLVIRDIVISGSKIGKEGKIRKQCPDCGNKTFHTFWGHGEAPAGNVTAVTNEEKFDKSKTLGEYWERTSVDFGSKQYSEASKARVNRMRQKAIRKTKKKND